VVAPIVSCHLQPGDQTIERRFHRVPCIGETIVVGDEEYRVTDVRWPADEKADVALVLSLLEWIA
jgi:hypothetical protein